MLLENIGADGGPLRQNSAYLYSNAAMAMDCSTRARWRRHPSPTLMPMCDSRASCSPRAQSQATHTPKTFTPVFSLCRVSAESAEQRARAPSSARRQNVGAESRPI